MPFLRSFMNLTVCKSVDIWSNMDIGLKQSSTLFENQDSCKLHDEVSSLEKAKWLTTSEAALYLRVSVSSIKMMVYRGTIRVRKLGRRNRFLREELDRAIQFPSNKKET
jgi:excisionase family DNA binding protein